ncbi:cytochrome-c oxidase, cbb3-type subunit III [Erythrobacter sp. EC-HK427]|uniref:cytochrome-c oxidase, cbb3-type subunit III n=1 Tax=Erythrobacter sp. EC-HK427 TaxID=2038396 RepID=UPI00125C1179|nr:cytochrome-c oxidase, cbb3-type subunit III [Erythrobacter sp. EC-HK427]VVT20885.1 Cbb3-type cytochrome c oxidase subunit FixP [Erythrobacter sp. EC-HK427]
MAPSSNDNTRIDAPTGTEFVGHEWDGIQELNTPLPRWWLWTFYACIAWAAVYVVLYPAWPMVERATAGTLGWTSRSDLAAEMTAAEAARADIYAQIGATEVTDLPANPELMAQAIAGGAAAFRQHCVQCHGAGAAGYEQYGYPNLNDDDWLWGGSLSEIEFTLTHGIRWEGSTQTRQSMMPAFGEVLQPAQIDQVVAHVLSLSGQGNGNAAGAALFETNCAVCHGSDGSGNRALGAPVLNDAIWLYGNSAANIRSQIAAPRHGVMPGWSDKLDAVTIRMLAAYIHSRGGGEAEAVEAVVEETDAAAPAESGGDA